MLGRNPAILAYMLKAFAYPRVSGKGQVDGDGFPRQREAIRQYAAAHGIRIVQEYQEQGVSDTKGIEERPAFDATTTSLLATARAW